MKTDKLLWGMIPVLLLITPVLAQKTVPAGRIIDQINQGQAVKLSDAVITGVLDLTEIDTKELVKKGSLSQEAYKSRVNVPLAFRNCTFKGDVIAYKVLDNKGEEKKWYKWNTNQQVLYTADFARQAVFEQCTFEGKSAFKYSDFAEVASFAGSRFSDEANFKYAKFHEGSSFPEADFSDVALFKYAKFDENADFSGAVFSSYADFKYAVFRE